MNDYFNELYPDGLDLTTFNDILRFDGDSVIMSIGGTTEDEDGLNEEISSSKKYIIYEIDAWPEGDDGWYENSKQAIFDGVEIENLQDNKQVFEILKAKGCFENNETIDDFNFVEVGENVIGIDEKETGKPLFTIALDDKSLTESNSSYKLRLSKRKSSWGEFKVKVYKDGKLDEDASYYTEDWDDAVGTFKELAKVYKLKITRDEPREKSAE